MEKPEHILCAAILFHGNIIAGHRHSDCYAIIRKLYIIYTGDENGIIPNLPDREGQGFLTSHNRYVDRIEAWKIAKVNDQIVYGKDSSDEYLISENLY